MNRAGFWNVDLDLDDLDTAASTLRIIDPSTSDHPQGPLAIATINVAAFSDLEQPLANAALMASAPELRNALYQLLREHDALTIATGGIPGLSDRWPAAADARAALARALQISVNDLT